MNEERFEALMQEVAALREQVAQLKAEREADADLGFSKDILPVLSAAIAAFLGKRAGFRVVRITPTAQDGWRQQGRAAIQGSHRTR